MNLRYDDHGDKPLCFVVKRERVNIKDKWVYFEPVNCGLTREELIRTLKDLHPPHTIGAGLDYVTTYVGW